MASTDSNSIWYVYGIVPADFARRRRCPTGSMTPACTVERRDGDVAALVSVLDSVGVRAGDARERTAATSSG